MSKHEKQQTIQPIQPSKIHTEICPLTGIHYPYNMRINSKHLKNYPND